MNKVIKITGIAFPLLFLLLSNIYAASTADAIATTNGWSLVFYDDFNDNSLDTTKWSRIDYNSGSAPAWRKYQSQDEGLVEFGTTDGNSTMTLWGKYGDYTTQNNQTASTMTYACGGVYTLKTFSFQYGYVEVRAKFDSCQGVWPAIWMLPVSGSWPYSGEIDIMEHLNYESKVYQTLHYSKDGSGSDTSSGVTASIDASGWHTYGVSWSEDAIVFYVDGNETGRWTCAWNESQGSWPFTSEENEFYLIIDQQIGGSWVEGSNGIDQSTLASSGAGFYIDYVRIFSSVVPEPSTTSFFLLGLAALAMLRIRQPEGADE